MKHKGIGSIVFVLGLLVALTPRYILPVCEWAGKKSGMVCGYTGRTEMLVGAIIISVAIGIFFSQGDEAVKWLMLVGIVSATAVVLIPSVIGYCPSSQMPCHYGTVPMLKLLGGLGIISSVVGIIIVKSKSSETT